MARFIKFPRQSVLSPLLAVAVNLLVVYLLYTLCRVEYLFENWTYFAESVSEGRLLPLMWAGVKFDTPGIFYTNALWVVLMLFPIHLKERPSWYRFCKWVFVIVNSVAVIVNIADSVYFSYILKRTAWSVFGEFGNETNFGKIIGLEFVRHWYLVIFGALLIWGMVQLYVQPAMNIRRQNLWRYYVVSVLSLALAALTVIPGIRGGFLNHWYNYVFAFCAAYTGWRLLVRGQGNGRRTAGWGCMAAAVVLTATAPIGGWRHRDIRPIAISNANAFTKRPVETALVLNTPFSMIRSIGNVPFHHPGYFADAAQMEQLFTPVHMPADSLVKRDKNLCIIIIESFGREYIGGMNREILGPDYKGYTPFTDSLLNHVAWWRYSYDNGQKSIDAMPSILASIPMFVRPFIVTPQAVNHLKGLPALLADKGYESAFFHGARTGSMGFDGFARSIGFEHYYGREDFQKDPRFDGENDFDGYWAIWDEPFLEWFALMMTDMKQPFVTALFTASNHHPFKIPEKYEGRFPEGTMPIHKTAGYTDNALRSFFAVAKRQPWFENTVFVITNDHTNMRGHDEYLSDIGAFYGPVLIYDPSGEITPGERDGLIQQIDIMPTLLGHVGYDKPYVAFGQDILHTAPSDAWAVNYYNGIYQYVKGNRIYQFDGNGIVGVYDINDHLMSKNLKSGSADEAETAQVIKAIVQQYMDRMLDDRLVTQ